MGLAFGGYCYSDPRVAMAVFNSYPDRFFGVSTKVLGQIRVVDASGTLKVQTSTLIGSTQSFLDTNTSLPTCDIPGPLNPLIPLLDLSIIEWVFGSGLILFVISVGIGSILSIVRKTRL